MCPAGPMLEPPHPDTTLTKTAKKTLVYIRIVHSPIDLFDGPSHLTSYYAVSRQHRIYYSQAWPLTTKMYGYILLPISITPECEYYQENSIRDRQEISWTIWGPSAPHIWSRPIEQNHRRSSSTSRISRLRSDLRWGAIGHSKVQVISCRSLSARFLHRRLIQNHRSALLRQCEHREASVLRLPRP